MSERTYRYIAGTAVLSCGCVLRITKRQAERGEFYCARHRRVVQIDRILVKKTGLDDLPTLF